MQLCNIGYVDNYINAYNGKEISITPKVSFADGNKVEGSTQLLVELSKGSTTNFSVTNDIATPQIVSFIASPNDPLPGQDYVATVTFTCYSTDTHVVMNILGTDGYSKTISCNGGPICQLDVPGAAELVVDTVTVMISDPSTNIVLDRTVIIVF